MARYLLIESRDPYEFAGADYFYDVAADLGRTDNDVTFLLIQNGVLVARRDARGHRLGTLQEAGSNVRILADDFSLRERGIPRNALAAGVEVTDVRSLVDMLVEDGRKAVWH